MRLTTTLRTSSVKWAAGPLLLLVWWYSSELSSRTVPAYWPDGTAVVAFCLFAMAPVCAMCAAWEADRLRKGRVTALAPARNRHVVYGQALAPVALLALASVLVSLSAVRLTMGPALGWPSLPVLGMVAAVLLGHTLLGFAAGCTLPHLLAPAIVLVLDYLWIALPPTFNTMWVRHLTGQLETGMPVTDDVNPTSLVAPALLALGVSFGAVLVSVAGRRQFLGAMSGALCAAVSCAMAYSLVSDWGPSAPVTPSANPAECRGKSPEICVPRELTTAIPVIEQAADEVLPRLAAVGIEEPQKLVHVSRATKTDETTWRVYAAPFLTDEDARASVAEAALPSLPDCFENTDSYVGDPNSLRMWLQLTAGVSPTAVANSYGPDAIGQIAPIRKLAQRDQADWFHRNAVLLKRCAPAPETVIAAP